jgi:hypothetical protein
LQTISKKFSRNVRRDRYVKKYNKYPLRTLRSLREKIMKKALITGITGQDGSYLTELLLEKGYEI